MIPAPPQTLISDQLNYLAQHSGVVWEHVPLTMARFKLHLKICDEPIVWQMEYQLLGADWHPDFIFPDDFNPMLPIPNLPVIGPMLLRWNMREPTALTKIVQAMLASYMIHQKALMQAEASHDDSLRQSLDYLLQHCPGTTFLYLPGSQSKAIIVVPVSGLDFSALESFFSTAWGVKDPKAVVNKYQMSIALKITYPMAYGSPTIQLQMPVELESILGGVALPSWQRGMDASTLLTRAKVTIQESCQTAGESAESRKQLLLALAATKLGQPAEIDMAGSRSAMFQLIFEGLQWNVYVDIARAFPAQQPSLRLEHKGQSTFVKTFKEFPWSPRWPAKEMANRIYTFLEETISNIE